MYLNDGNSVQPPALPAGQGAPIAVSVPDHFARLDHVARVDPATIGGLWALMRRHRLLVALSVIGVTVLVGLYTIFSTRIYESTASIRLEDTKLDLPSLVTRLGQDRDVSTEQEALESQVLAEAVIDSLGLRAITTPLNVPRTALFTRLQVSAVDDSASYSFHRRESDGAYVVHDEFSDKDVSAVRPGGTVTFPAVTATLSPTLAINSFTLTIRRLQAAAESFSKALKVTRPDRDANILQVAYRGPDKALVRDVPNVLAALFIADRQGVSTAEARSTATVLREQLDSVARELNESESALQRFREANNVVSLPDEATTDVTHLAETQADRNSVAAERDALSTIIAKVTAEAATQQPGQPSPYQQLIAFPTLLRNNTASTLLSSLATVEDQRAALLQRRTMKDADVQVLTDRINDIEQQLHGIATTYLEGLNAQVGADDSVLHSQQASMQSIPAKQIELAQLSRQPDVLQDIYTTLQTRLKEAQVAAAVKDPSVHVLDPAELARKPVRPRPLLYGAAGIVLGFMLGLALAYMRETRDHAIHTRADVLAATGAPVLGLIPRMNAADRFLARLRLAEELGPPGATMKIPLRGKARALAERANGNGGSGVALNDPAMRSPVAEAYSTLQTNLAFMNPDAKMQVIVLTSPLSGDGKTTSAANLAVTLVQRGQNVLLIDADLRRGIVNRVFGAQREPGLTNILDGSSSLESAVRRVDLGRAGSLHYVTTGTLPSSPAAVLSSKPLPALLDRLKQHYDTIIVDSPPINVVTDAALLGKYADGVVLIVRAGVTPVQALTFAAEQLRHVHAPILGAVLNDIDFHRDSVYDGAYRFYGHRDRYYMAEA
jgi:polysaccharide biosynthesis transport protein